MIPNSIFILYKCNFKSACISIGLIVFFYLNSTISYADVTTSVSLSPDLIGCSPSPGLDGGCISIVGQITRQDVEIVKREISDGKLRQTAVFFLNTPGGNVNAAVDIGRLMRQLRAIAVVLKPNTCASACVFLLAGAVEREVSGAVMIHRPFLETNSLDSFSVLNSRKKVLDRYLRNYLEEMNIPGSLFETMMTIPSEEARILTKRELMAFGLGQVDAVESEVRNSTKAIEYGLTKVQYLQRKANIKLKCDPLINSGEPQSYYSCRDAILSRK